ncbi:MAG: hypothetical protein ACRCXD_02120 [Luteolibacter sp.]
MKHYHSPRGGRLMIGLLAGLYMSSSTFAADAVPTRSPIPARTTPEALAKLQKTSPIARLKQPAKDEVTVARPSEQSIIKQSSILHDGTNWTLVPRGAVIFVPNAQKARVDVKPVGNLLSWADFLAKNRSWITTAGVTFEQAAGNEPTLVERSTFWAKQDKVVVAIHHNGPISVRVAPETTSLTQR